MVLYGNRGCQTIRKDGKKKMAKEERVTQRIKNTWRNSSRVGWIKVILDHVQQKNTSPPKERKRREDSETESRKTNKQFLRFTFYQGGMVVVDSKDVQSGCCPVVLGEADKKPARNERKQIIIDDVWRRHVNWVELHSNRQQRAIIPRGVGLVGRRWNLLVLHTQTHTHTWTQISSRHITRRHQDSFFSLSSFLHPLFLFAFGLAESDVTRTRPN